MTVEEPEERMESMKEARGPNGDKTCKYKGFFMGEERTETMDTQ